MVDSRSAGPGGGVEVDPAALHDFASVVRGGLDGSLRGQVSDVFGAYGQGATFGLGWCGSGVVRGAQADYHACLTATTKALVTYVEVTAAFVAAAERVARNYADCDVGVVASVKDVDAGLVEGYRSVTVSGAAETRREWYRGSR